MPRPGAGRWSGWFGLCWTVSWLASAPAAADGAPEDCPGGQAVRVVVVRHAEKAEDGTDDPPLTAAGRQRAGRLADRLTDAGITAVFATQYRRTRQTAEPTARRAGLKVSVRAVESGRIEESVAALADEIFSEHAGGSVLVVGHSNTVPMLVAQLSGRPVPPMGEDEYDRIEDLSVCSGQRDRPSLPGNPSPDA